MHARWGNKVFPIWHESSFKTHMPYHVFIWIKHTGPIACFLWCFFFWIIKNCSVRDIAEIYIPWNFLSRTHRWIPLQWRGSLMLSLICAWTNCWANNREADDLGRHHAHYDVTVMFQSVYLSIFVIHKDRYHTYDLYVISATPCC